MGLAVRWTALSACAVLSLAAWGPPCGVLDAPAFLERGLLLCVLAAAALIDARSRIIPNAVPVAVVLIHAAFMLAYALVEGVNPVPLARGSLVGALILGGGLLAFTLAFEAMCGAGESEALGGGDIKLVAALGFSLGCSRAALLLAIACVAFALYGSCRALLARVRGREAETAHPFAPALALAAYLVFLV